MLLPVHVSAQSEASLVYSGQVAADASSSSANVTRECEIFFRFDKTDIDLDYLSNNANIAALRHYMAVSHRVDSITIYSYASPEGRLKHNQWLSQERASAVKNILLEHSPDSSILNAGMIRICPLSENWPGLIREVEKRYQRHDRERVLRILNTKNISDDTRKWRLSRLDKGYTWSFLKRIYMPELRVATWVCVYGDLAMPLEEIDVPSTLIARAHLASADPANATLAGKSLLGSFEQVAVAGTVKAKADRTSADKPEISIATSEISSAEYDSSSAKSEETHSQELSQNLSQTLSQSEPLNQVQRTVVALKTNLLLDAVTALNYSVEVPVNEHVSFQYFQTTPWWNNKKNNFCLQFLSFGGEARWWFLPRPRPASDDLKQRDALMGHFIGAYGWGGNGDLQLGRNVCQQFDFWSAGLTYGYAMPVSKNLNMEFTLSVGYANINYQHYVPTDDFGLLVRDADLAGKLHYIGPTKAEISLIVPIRANVNKKGGRK